MKRFTLFTEGYIAKIRDHFAITHEEKCGTNHALSFVWEGGNAALARALMEILEGAALEANSVYRHSPAMRNLARKLRVTQAYKDEITALTILYNGTWKTRPLTLQMVQEVYDAMQKRNLNAERLWGAYSHTQKEKVKAKSPVSKLIDIVSLLRFELGITTELAPYSDTVNYNFMRWTMAKNAGNVHFTDEQMNWLRMVKDFIANSMAITADYLNLAPFNRHGGLGKFYNLFGDGYEKLLDEMNLALAA